MQSDVPQTPTFNLWYAPWITLEDAHGRTVRAGIEQTLRQAAAVTAIHDPSPLVVVGIYRLLLAVLQDALNPTQPSDLRNLWREGHFPDQALSAFGARYADRFDLFSPDRPFMQSADAPLRPGKRDPIKTVAYLAPEIPAGSAVTHYRHGVEAEQVFCAACAAAGLTVIPAFATSGGRTMKPSINGVPPIYVLPGGATLFESLVRGLVLPAYQPEVRSSPDLVWWRREPIVRREQEVSAVGYLHSLTFAARRVRLHPEPMTAPCSRCGALLDWGVRTMIFEMGEFRSDDAPAWFDPFVSYELPDSKQRRAKPTPLRPQPAHALWREYGSLFLKRPETGAASGRTRRPSVIDQLAELTNDLDLLAFRCVGLRTDMKAKVFEWIEAGFEVSPQVLNDPGVGDLVAEAMRFATDCADIIRKTFRQCLGGDSRKSERHRELRNRMEDAYWAALAQPFREFVLTSAAPDQRDAVRRQWIETAIQAARRAFQDAAAAVGDDAASLRQRVQGETRVEARLAKKRKEYLNE
jgi:CRISPR system Cascade subunit CasA